jgi:AraC-like DNA-binding protein
MRQVDPKPGVSIATLAYDYPAGYRVPEHAHVSNQLIYATHGVMEISARQSLWITPPNFAIWIPARMPHQIRMSGAVSMRTLYMRTSLSSGLPDDCVVLHVTPLLRELVVEAVRTGNLRSRNALHCALRDLLLAQLRNARSIPSSAALPRDPRAVAVAQALVSNLAESKSLALVCAKIGVSVRTIERIYLKETGTGFETWRRQVRLMKGLELLSAGCSVKETAYAVGYRQPSAFVEMFRQTLGTTPGIWSASLVMPR